MASLELNELQVEELKSWVEIILGRIGKDPNYFGNQFPKEFFPKTPEECIEVVVKIGHEMERMRKAEEKHRLKKEAWKGIKEQLDKF